MVKTHIGLISLSDIEW